MAHLRRGRPRHRPSCRCEPCCCSMRSSPPDLHASRDPGDPRFRSLMNCGSSAKTCAFPHHSRTSSPNRSGTSPRGTHRPPRSATRAWRGRDARVVLALISALPSGDLFQSRAAIARSWIFEPTNLLNSVPPPARAGGLPQQIEITLRPQPGCGRCCRSARLHLAPWLAGPPAL